MMRLAAARLDERTIADDEMNLAGKCIGNGAGKIEAPPSYEGYLDAVRRGSLNGAPIGFWDLRSAIEQSSIDIERDQADLMLAVREWHFAILHAASRDSAFRESLVL